MSLRAVPQMEHPVEAARHSPNIPHAQHRVRLKQEKIPAAARVHAQLVSRLRRNNQHIPLLYRVVSAVHEIVHAPFQGQQHLHRGMKMGFILPRHIRIPDPEGGILRVGHILPFPLQNAKTVFIPALPVRKAPSVCLCHRVHFLSFCHPDPMVLQPLLAQTFFLSGQRGYGGDRKAPLTPSRIPVPCRSQNTSAGRDRPPGSAPRKPRRSPTAP